MCHDISVIPLLQIDEINDVRLKQLKPVPMILKKLMWEIAWLKVENFQIGIANEQDSV